ncbi:MAG: RNA methyltransferase [Verrucomicrobiales bacterium]|jgi:tRNA (guanosine-2'-O-)-methyltransferase|nr:RNA methyltransferase [Verrucomicrobiales bacterium]MDP4939385.1 RNA methyltransferase [Verrucomicrobiales bacterium]
MTADEELTDFLGSHITENKREKIVSVLNDRTRHFTVLLEDIYQPHNASACLRSCDCLGLQDVHIVESRNDYRPNNNVSMGSSKWLTLHRYHRAESAIETLKARGFRLIATSPNEDGYDLSTLPIDKPVALLFGSEHKGLSASAMAAAEGYLRIPMYGFTESFNISVTLALAISRLVERLRESGLAWQLSDEEKKELTLRFYRRIVTRHDLLEEKFWERRGEGGK